MQRPGHTRKRSASPRLQRRPGGRPPSRSLCCTRAVTPPRAHRDSAAGRTCGWPRADLDNGCFQVRAIDGGPHLPRPAVRRCRLTYGGDVTTFFKHTKWPCWRGKHAWKLLRCVFWGAVAVVDPLGHAGGRGATRWGRRGQKGGPSARLRRGVRGAGFVGRAPLVGWCGLPSRGGEQRDCCAARLLIK